MHALQRGPLRDPRRPDGFHPKQESDDGSWWVIYIKARRLLCWTLSVELLNHVPYASVS
jgi:hypothetical protein